MYTIVHWPCCDANPCLFHADLWWPLGSPHETLWQGTTLPLSLVLNSHAYIIRALSVHAHKPTAYLKVLQCPNFHHSRILVFWGDEIYLGLYMRSRRFFVSGWGGGALGLGNLNSSPSVWISHRFYLCQVHRRMFSHDTPMVKWKKPATTCGDQVVVASDYYRVA